MIKKTILFFAFIAIAFATMAQADTLMFPLPKDLPKYPEGRQALEEFIQQNIVYPEYEKLKGIEGTVTVYCDVELDGTLSNFRIGSTVEGSVGFDAEAIRVCQKIGKFTPCIRNGKPICYMISIDVTFDLNNGDEMEMAIAKLSKKELKEIEKDAKWSCWFTEKTTDAAVTGDVEKYEKLTSKYQKELDALNAKYTLGTPKNAQYEKLTKPCMEEMFKRMGIVDVDGDGLFTQEEAELTPKELKQIKKDGKLICDLFFKIIEAKRLGDKDKSEKLISKYQEKLKRLSEKYSDGSNPRTKELVNIINPCAEEAMKAALGN